MKSILVFSSVFFISIAALFQTNNVVVTSNLPNFSKPGESVNCEIVISKGSLGGFSKFQMMLPDGFEAEAVDVKGGTFSFVDQKLKVIWVALPSDPKFSLNFSIKTAPDAAGSFPLEGQFSYIQNGERSDASFNTKIFIAKDKPADLVAIETANKEENPSATTSELANTETSEVAPTSTGFDFSRSLSSQDIKPLGSATVKLTIGKKGISGFGKITEIIPSGFSAEQIESNGAIFSVLNNEVRFLWMTLPATDSFEVSYKLVANNQAGQHSIKGSFSYVEDTKTRLNSTSATSFNVVKENAVASTETPSSETASTESSPAEIVSSEKSVTTEEKITSEASETTTDSNEVSEQELTVASTESTELSETSELTDGEVSYRVQICATRKAVDKQYFVKNNQVAEVIYADMHEGWHKFTVGAFGVYGDARNHREVVKDNNKIKGPFVTAYNSGARITVQEALMITKQQWIP